MSLNLVRRSLFLAVLLGVFALRAGGHRAARSFARPDLPQIENAQPAQATQTPAPANSTTRIQLTVVEREGLKPVSPSMGLYDCGIVDPIQTPRVERTFTLRNDNKQAVTIDSLRASCGCENVTMFKNGTALTQATLEPGEQVDVKVGVSLLRQRSGEKHATVFAYERGGFVPLASLEIVIHVARTVEFSPAVLDFGRPAAGSGRSLPLIVTFDARLITPPQTLKLVSSTPYVTISPDGEEHRFEQDGKTRVQRVYRIQLQPSTPIGHLAGTLALVPDNDASAPAPTKANSAHNPKQTRPEEIEKTALPGFSMPLMAEVGSSVTVSPGALVLGSVRAGSAYMRPVLLSAPSLAALRNLKLTSSSPLVSARIRNPAQFRPDVGSATQPVEITLNAVHAPSGSLNAAITITLRSGEKLVLPVIAQIDAVPGH